MSDTDNYKFSRSILLVEDDKHALDLLASMLAMKFPDVVLHTASNGKVGLDLFNAHLPDVVITDFNMPEMSGEEMSNKIRAVKPDVKIILITGRSANTTSLQTDQSGFMCDQLIIKPVDFSKLFTLIDKYFGEIEQQIS